MDIRRFTRLNAIGATAWTGIFLLAGFVLGNVPAVKENLEVTVLWIVIGTTLLLPLEILRDRIVAYARR